MRKVLYQTFVLQHSKDGETTILQAPEYVLGKSHGDVYAKIVRSLTQEQVDQIDTLDIAIRPMSGDGRNY